MTRARSRTRAVVRGIAVSAVPVVLISALANAATADDPSSPSGQTAAQVATQPAGYSDGNYIVVTRDRGATRQPGLRAAGNKFDARTAKVRTFRQQQAAKHSRIAAAVGATVRRHYSLSFSGFAARLTGAQATRLAASKNVLLVQKDEARKVDTWNTPSMLGLAGQTGLWSKLGGPNNAGDGVVVGIIDTGAWPESESFAGAPLTSRPQGKWGLRSVNGVTVMKKADGGVFSAPCQTSHTENGKTTPAQEWTAANCNSKLVSARYYPDTFLRQVPPDKRSPTERISARDGGGHGSHTASTAVGNNDVPATAEGRDFGKISGMAPGAKLAVYKVCFDDTDASTGGCYNSSTLAAIEDAINDGVDVLNFSISGAVNTVVDAVEVAFEGAAEAGIFVAASAGNSGPGASTVAHNSPWLTTVANATHYAFENTVVLGDGTKLKGASIASTAVPSAPLVDARTAAAAGANPDDAARCFADSLDPAKVTGKIVACARGVNARVDKSLAVQEAGGAGMILYNTSAAADDIASDFHYVPTVHAKFADSAALTAYAKTAGAKAALSKGEQYVAEAPEMASFSSAGPALAGDGDLLKPDITAPGVDVIAAVAPPGNAGANFASYQGTSMSSPHIAGLAALLIGKHPAWNPMWVKSALMTTASQVDNEGEPIKRGAANATPLDFGAGHVDPKRSFDPGLVYDSSPRDWVAYMCALGQGESIGAPCDRTDSIDPSNLNYPSIAVGDLAGTQTVNRRVTNTTGKLAFYRPQVEAPAGTTVTVRPSGLVVAPHRSASFQVKITRTDAAFGDYSFGSLTWSDGLGHEVRSPIAVRPVSVAAPKSASGSGTSGSLQLAVKAGYDGTLKASAAGLVADTVTELPLANPDGSGFDTDNPAAGEHTGKVSVTVPEGAKLARFATFDADYASLGEGTDIDLFVYKKTADGLELVGDSATATAEESVTMTEPGDYEIYVDLYALPAGVTSATVQHHHWVLGDPAGNIVLAPESQRVRSGDSASVTVSWSGLRAGTHYLGAVLYADEDAELGNTILTITG